MAMCVDPSGQWQCDPASSVTRAQFHTDKLKESKYKDYTHGAEISTTQLCRRIDSVSEFSTPPRFSHWHKAV